MAALPAGVQYGLSSESSYKENKELVFVKLTDSALKAIEDFIRNNRDKLAKPKIQFLPGNEGKISIPVPTNGASSESTFHFSINSNAEMEGPQGSFECVRGGAGARRLECCGPLPRRMRVLANDDSYEATKDRMARTVAAEQSKCTRVIKPNQTDIGRRINKRLSHTTYSNGAAQLAERAERAEKERLERLERERAERAERERVERAERERVERAERERVERAERERAERAERERAERLERERVERVERERAERAERERAERPDRAERAERAVPRGAPPPHQRPPPAADVSRRSINERLIQLLALKPFKKPELYARLNSEGIKEKDRAEVNKILPKIGSLKDNCYHLRRHIWNDVNEDWPFYTEEEKRLLKRRKPQNLTPPLSSDSANSLSPRASPASGSGGSGGGGGGGKRAPAGDEDTPAAKKKRISHYRRPSPPSSGYATTSSGERHASDNEDDRTNVKKDNGYTLNFNTVKDLCPSPVKPNGFRNSPTVEQTSITEKDITNTEPLETTDLTSVPDENMTDLVDIERQYPAIASSGTRRAYKQEFSELYTEYRSLYARVAQVAALFSQLEQQLRRTEPASPQRRTIEQRIVEEYQRVRNNSAYQRERRRVNYLHRKLNHIKRMVQQYDQLRNLKPERVSAASTTQAY